MSPWFYSGCVVVAGFVSFLLRRKCRVAYGIVEIIAAFLMMYLQFFPHGGYVFITSNRPVFPETLMDKVSGYGVPLFVMVYAFAQGCENIAAGWPWRKLPD
jgi:hypothetical protein